MKHLNSILLILVLTLFGCANTHLVSTNHCIAKRKYTKGFYFNFNKSQLAISKNNFAENDKKISILTLKPIKDCTLIVNSNNAHVSENLINNEIIKLKKQAFYKKPNKETSNISHDIREISTKSNLYKAKTKATYRLIKTVKYRSLKMGLYKTIIIISGILVGSVLGSFTLIILFMFPIYQKLLVFPDKTNPWSAKNLFQRTLSITLKIFIGFTILTLLCLLLYFLYLEYGKTILLIGILVIIGILLILGDSGSGGSEFMERISVGGK